jgi:hypothetical protein
VEPVGVDASSIDVGCVARAAAVRSASLVSSDYEYDIAITLPIFAYRNSQALMYSSCARSRTSRASNADRYSASGLLMAGGEKGRG